ncbi:helix-turn-helix domain-containing protein [Nocardioides sp.]|uniref:helix-turn-helix domain-containing protein n=1 Tax=Nocardioides sp. TaxID=35761 RepID=UPI002C8C5CF4|nr:helix-turn-helix domain-containing protein [Nocardioides sp.]HSX65946.1 helix-turn-helix domain-containing protein [Nocardioides sp.]
MTADGNTKTETVAETLGDVLRNARHEAGYTIKGLAQMSGVPGSQIAKLEHDEVQKPNVGHLATLAGPLNLNIYTLYKAAGYRTPDSISGLAPELEEALSRMPRDLLAKVERYIEELVPTPVAPAPAPQPDEFNDI